MDGKKPAWKNPALEEARQRALKTLGERWLLARPKGRLPAEGLYGEPAKPAEPPTLPPEVTCIRKRRTR